MKLFLKCLLMLPLLALLSGCQTNPLGVTSDRQVRHVMICWLKPEADRAAVIRGVGEFANAPGVLDYSAGYEVETENKNADNQFGVGVFLTFGTADQLRAFHSSDVYKRVEADVLKPNVEKVVEYNATIELYDYGAETEEATRLRRAASLKTQRDIMDRR